AGFQHSPLQACVGPRSLANLSVGQRGATVFNCLSSKLGFTGMALILLEVLRSVYSILFHGILSAHVAANVTVWVAESPGFRKHVPQGLQAPRNHDCRHPWRLS